MEARNKEFNEIWNQDAFSIGRVLRSHLVVEFHLTRHLQFRNPNLGDIDAAGLTYAQKVDLIGPNVNHLIADCLPGLRHLGKIRNRLAHNLNVNVTQDDRNAFLSMPLYLAFRNAAMKHQGVKPDDPLSVMEHFSLHAGCVLHNDISPHSSKWAEALSSDSTTSEQSN
jgi:hypothetical protein